MANQKTRWRSIKDSLNNGMKLFNLIFNTNKFYLGLSIVGHLLQGLIPFFSLIVMQSLLNSVSTAVIQGIDTLFIPFIYFVLIYISKILINSGQAYIEGNLEASLSKSINVMIFQKSNELGLEDYENSSINDQLKRATQEANFRPYQLYSQLAEIISSLITVISSAVWLFLWKWWVVPVLIVVSLASLYSLFRINREQFQIYLKRTPQYRQAWYMTYLLTNDKAVKEIKIYQTGSHFLKLYSDLLEGFFTVDRKMLRKVTKYTLIYNILEVGAMLYVVWLAIKETLLSSIMIGSLYGYIQAIMLTQSQIQSIMRNTLQFSQNHFYVEQLLDFFKLPTTDPVYRLKAQKQELEADVHSEFHINKIELRNIFFKYPGQEKYVLNNISLSFKKGDIVAIVGENGSGKSTLMKLLMQLYSDYQGQIDINSKNIKQFELEKYQQKIGAVFQDFVQYEMSVRYNIGLGSLELMYEDKEIMDAAKYAAIDSIINSLPQGLDTQLGKWFEKGVQLSGGQWQRLAIARAFLRKADVYVLDEPSAFLDPIAEKELLELFIDLMKEKIGLFVTHRISSARLANYIIVMESGKVIEQGIHEELIQKAGVYADMYNIQAESFYSASMPKRNEVVHL